MLCYFCVRPFHGFCLTPSYLGTKTAKPRVNLNVWGKSHWKILCLELKTIVTRKNNFLSYLMEITRLEKPQSRFSFFRTFVSKLSRNWRENFETFS